jgi:hypothetical protein
LKFKRRTIRWMLRVFTPAAFLLAALPVRWAGGTPSQGGRGLVYVQSPRTISKGYLEVHLGTRYFGKVANFRSAGTPYTLWDVQGTFSVNYGLNDHLEIFLSPILYQDINRPGGNFWKGKANFPDDLFLGVKAGSFGGLENSFRFGALLSLRLPSAKNHNVIYEPYSAGAVGVELTGLASYYRNPAFPDAAWSIHTNLGYVNHNDVGKPLSSFPDALVPLSMSSEVTAGIGFLMPEGSFDFSAEMTARSFLSRPPETAYTREYSSYLTLGVYYRPSAWLQLEMAMDKSLLIGEDLTDYQFLAPKRPNFPNMPSWRGVLGVRLAVLPASLYRSAESDLRQKARDRQTILENMIENQTDVDSAEQELTRIQAERKKVEEELERLRKMLDAEKEKKSGEQP